MGPPVSNPMKWNFTGAPPNWRDMRKNYKRSIIPVSHTWIYDLMAAMGISYACTQRTIANVPTIIVVIKSEIMDFKLVNIFMCGWMMHPPPVVNANWSDSYPPLLEHFYLSCAPINCWLERYNFLWWLLRTSCLISHMCWKWNVNFI